MTPGDLSYSDHRESFPMKWLPFFPGPLVSEQKRIRPFPLVFLSGKPNNQTQFSNSVCRHIRRSKQTSRTVWDFHYEIDALPQWSACPRQKANVHTLKAEFSWCKSSKQRNDQINWFAQMPFFENPKTGPFFGIKTLNRYPSGAVFGQYTEALPLHFNHTKTLPKPWKMLVDSPPFASLLHPLASEHNVYLCGTYCHVCTKYTLRLISMNTLTVHAIVK